MWIRLSMYYRTKQIFYFRTYTKYIFTIQYMTTYVTFGICYTEIIHMLFFFR